MPPARTELRVRYGETDQMGVVHHSAYIHYFEVGRTEFLRGGGVSYATMEREGMVLAVVDMGARFRRPARFDEVLAVETRLVQATRIRVRFEYVISRRDATPEGEEETVLCTGFTALACINRKGRPSKILSPYREILEAAVEP